MPNWKQSFFQFLKKAEKQKTYYVEAEIEQGRGNHCDRTELVIASVLKEFQENEAYFQKKYRFSYEHQQDNQHRNRIRVRIYFYDVIDYGDEIEFPSLIGMWLYTFVFKFKILCYFWE